MMIMPALTPDEEALATQVADEILAMIDLELDEGSWRNDAPEGTDLAALEIAIQNKIIGNLQE